MCKLSLGRHSSRASQLQANTWAEASLPNAMELSYLETQDTMTTDQQEMPAATARPKPKRMCQVPGCTADLEAIGKPYCCMKRICPVHMKADVIPMCDQYMRYCQQCGTLEPLTLFESNKRSCRDSLGRRIKRPAQPEQKRERRKRRQVNATSSNDASNGSWGFPAAAAAPASRRGRNAHVMAQLQDRLYALQSQMEDMQLMLGLLQDC